MVRLLPATALWGFGVWRLGAAALLLVHYLQSGPLPFGIGWWGFTFPLGAYTVATLTLAKAWGLSGLDWAGAALFILLGVFWLVVSGRTLWAVGTGEAGGSPRCAEQPCRRAPVQDYCE